MKNIYFCYRYRINDTGVKYCPDQILGMDQPNKETMAYPEWYDNCTFNVEKVVTTDYGKKLGWIEVNELSLDPTIVSTEISNIGVSVNMGYMTEPEVIIYLDTYTNYIAVPISGGFEYVIQEEDIEFSRAEIKISLSST